MYNFGKIDNAFHELMIESLLRKNNSKRKIFTEYLKSLKSNKVLNVQYHVYRNIENINQTDSFKANELVKANISILREYKKEEILQENNKLIKLLGEKYKNKLELSYNKDLMNLHEKIANTISLNNIPQNTNLITEGILNITECIKNKSVLTECSCQDTVIEDEEKVLIPTKILADVAILKFNEEYQDLSEDQRNTLRLMVSGNEEEKKNLQQNITNECIQLIDTKYNNSNTIEEKEVLLKTKNKLMNTKYNPNSYLDEMVKIITLRGDLLS